MYGFAFIKNLSSKVLYKLRNVDCCYLLAGKSSIDKYMEFLLHDQPENILGMGVYTGRDQDKIRIETKCSNKFRNKLIKENSLIEYDIDSFITPSEKVKTASGIGNSYCNYVSFRIMELIKNGKLNCNYTFLHIPKKRKFYEVATLIDKQLDNYLSSTSDSVNT